jgi:hypothetical protein
MVNTKEYKMSQDPHKHMSKEDEQNPLKVQNLAPEPAKCQECGQLVPGGIDEKDQKSGKFSDIDKGAKPKMRHGAY